MKAAGKALLAMTLLLQACGGSEAFAPLAAGGGGPPITTDATEYTLREQGRGLAVDIHIRFQNQSNSRMYIVNCHRLLSPVLEKRVGGEWVPMWWPAQPMCLTPPIELRPGEVLERTVNVWGALPGSNDWPQWESADVAGTYRLVLGALVYNYRDSGQGFGEPVPLALRVSNEFELIR